MKKLLLVLLLLGFIQSNIFAQLSTSSAFGVRYVVPTGTTADVYDNGFGITGSANFSVIPILDIMIEGSWHVLKMKDLGVLNDMLNENLSISGLVVGPVLTLGFVDVGIKGGYFFGDVSEWAVFPFAQIDVLMFSVGAEYKAVGNTKWAAAYLNFNF